MKVLYLTPGCFDKGGISRYNRYQINAIRSIVGESKMKVMSLAGPQPGDFEEKFDVDYYGQGVGIKSKCFFSARALGTAMRWKPDVIWIAHVNFSGLGALMAKLCGAKTVLNTYGLEVWSGLSWDAAKGLAMMDHVVSDCHYTAKYLENEKLRPVNSTTVIWDCVDLDRFSPSEKMIDEEIVNRYGLPHPKDHDLILTLGRIARAAAHKGYDRLIKAFARVAPKFPKARLVLAGKGNLIDDLKKMCVELGIQNQVTFTGMVEEMHLPGLYRMAYVFSLVSDRGVGRGEGIPLTPLEAMACGVPVVVGNQDGSREAVVNQRNGFIIDSLDVERQADVLSNLLSDPGLRTSMATAAVAVAKENFSYEGFLKKHKDFLSSLNGIEK